MSTIRLETHRPIPIEAATAKAGLGQTGPSARVRLGIERNRTTAPELHPERAVSVTRSYRETEGQPLFTRRGRMLLRIVTEHPVKIQEGELIVGMKTLTPRGSPVFPEVSCDWVERDLERLATRSSTPFHVSEPTKQVLRAEVFPYWKGRQISDRIMEAVPADIWRADERGLIYNYFRSRTIGHINAGYAKVLTRGMEGIIADVEQSLARLDYHDRDCVHKRQFLQSVIMACEAAVLLAGRYAAEARHLAVLESDPIRRSELLTTAAILERVPAKPAVTFQEALQSFWITQLMLNLETDGHAFGPGRFDQYIYPYYRHSIDSGEITQAQAQELLDLLWVKLDEITLAKDSGEAQTSSSYPEFQNLNIGGLTRQGRDAVNEVSYMCLEALEHTLLPQPGLSAQIASLTPPKFLMRCCEVLRLGTGMPAMFNSDVMVLGMVNRGKTLSDARASSLNGCVAVFCDGKDRMASTGYFNLAKALELALNNGVDRLTGEPLGPQTGEPRAFASFDEVVAAFEAQVEHFVALKVRYDNTVRDIYARYCPVPFTSAVVDDCIAAAVDWHAGGSHYKIATMSGVAVGTVADALSGIRTHVFDKRSVGMPELIDALDRNWEGQEALRLTLVNKTPHYGNDDDDRRCARRAGAGDLLLGRGTPLRHPGRQVLGGPAAHHEPHRPGGGDRRDTGRPPGPGLAVRGGEPGSGPRPEGPHRLHALGVQAGPRPDQRNPAQRQDQPPDGEERPRPAEARRSHPDLLRPGGLPHAVQHRRPEDPAGCHGPARGAPQPADPGGRVLRLLRAVEQGHSAGDPLARRTRGLKGDFVKRPISALRSIPSASGGLRRTMSTPRSAELFAFANVTLQALTRFCLFGRWPKIQATRAAGGR